MKRLIAATAIALAANTALANDVTSVIPAAPLGSASQVLDTVANPAVNFGSQDVVSVVPAAPARESSATVDRQVLATQTGRFGNEDVISVVQ